MPISHDCHQSHGDQWLWPDRPLLMDDENKEFLNQKDDSTNPTQRLALKGQDYFDIFLFENSEVIWTKVSRGDSGIVRKPVKQQEIEIA